MELDELERFMDDEGLGDPAIVELLNAEIPDFLEYLRHEEKDDTSVAYIAATASLFKESVDAFELLVKMRGVVEKQSDEGWKKFYDGQQAVWRRRKNKSQHDLQYLRIVLGMRQSPPREDELPAEDLPEPQPQPAEDFPEPQPQPAEDLPEPQPQPAEDFPEPQQT